MGAVVFDEGRQLDHKGVTHPSECMNKCDENAGCESFTFCSRDDNHEMDCYLKDKQLEGNEETNGVSNCASYYKKCDSGNYSDISYKY